MAEIRIEPYNKTRHKRSGFSCGQPTLDEFLRSLVTQYERRRLGKTFVAVQNDGTERVVGYYTLAASAVAFGHLPEGMAEKLPRHPVPVILLARLAVDHSVQGHGFGARLLRDALQRAIELSKSLGVFAVEVVAIDEHAAAFYAKFGFVPLLDDPRHMYLPIRTIVQATRGA